MKSFNIFNKSVLIASTALISLGISAKERAGAFKLNHSQKVMAGCNAAQTAAELTINNVRTIIYAGSDMWWDLFGTGNAWYAVPKVEKKSDFVNSTFAGNVWFGGIDDANNLKVAAQTYRQGGIDFWTGPLNTTDASIDASTCVKYDKIFRLYRSEVDEFVFSDFAADKITQNIKDWPGTPNDAGVDPLLAPWVDKNGVPGGDGVYQPDQGDYPYYDVYNNLKHDALGQCKAKVYGDETLWWVYNDNGNTHQATQGTPIGMEVRAQAFAFKTTDEINNMTFYNYQIINRSTATLNETYMTVWTDADLGCYLDDYIGCDVQRGLGYIYNGDPNDDDCSGVKGYGAVVPALGCDFFQGPINTTNGIDDDHDNGSGKPNSGIDEPGEQMGMTKFMYFNNSTAGIPDAQTDPDNAQQYYNYMRGFWKDGSPLTFGGDGFQGTCSTNYAYPDNTDIGNACGTQWSESLTPADRRFLQSSGPFTLLPGAVNYVTVGLPWARTTDLNSPTASIPLLKIADDKAQALFDNCFQVISGPEAPDITIQELPNELILYFSNSPNSNNYLFKYEERDPNIAYDTTHFPKDNNKYVFEGYVVYQLKNESVSIDDLSDNSKAKLVFQSDLNNGIKRIVNYEFDAASNADAPKVKVDGIDNGIKTTFRFTKDAFSKTADQKVINSKQYYFMAVAYGYNQYGAYKADAPYLNASTPSYEGQKKPYLQGRLTKKGSGIPQDPRATGEEQLANSIYGYGPKVTRIEGQGNGGNNMDLTQSSIDAIVANGNRVDAITYENGRGPLGIKIVDPLNVPNTEFSVKFVSANWHPNKDTVIAFPCKDKVYKDKEFPKQNLKNTQFGSTLADSTTWVLTDLASGKEYIPCKSIKIGEEFYFNELGLSINVSQVKDLGNIGFPLDATTDRIVSDGDLLGSSMEFSDPTQVWLTGVKDAEITQDFHGKNWIRAGGFSTEDAAKIANRNDYKTDPNGDFVDPKQVFENVLGGTWAPYCLTAATKSVGSTGGEVTAAPAWENMITATQGSPTRAQLNQAPYYDIRAVGSVNIVLTKDKSKWTRSIVLEECDYANTNPTGARKLEPRRALCVDKQGYPLGHPNCNTSEATIDSVAGIQYRYGLSWFPGYAVNIETGERLNIAFGEDSYQGSWNPDGYRNNGDDMMWNPTATETKLDNNGRPVDSDEKGYPYQFGGRHYIYVFGNNRSSTKYGKSSNAIAAYAVNKRVGVGTYASFSDFAFMYKTAYANSKGAGAFLPLSGKNALHNIWSEAMWVNIPLVSGSKYLFTNPANMPCDVTVKLRVKKSYRYGLAGNFYTGSSSQADTAVAILAGGVLPTVNLMAISHPTLATNFTYTNEVTRDTAKVKINNNFGYYTFNTSDVYSLARTGDVAKSALDLINVVPNPYYGYSKYETDRSVNTIRFTNLPNVCKIKIFTLNGTLIRSFDRDVSAQYDVYAESKGTEFNQSKRKPFYEWDLKNQNGIAIASGLYIIHIDVPGVGEKILKWFGVMRPLDLQNY